MKRNSFVGQIFSFVISVAIIAAGVFGFRMLVYRPEAIASGPAEPTIPLVRTRPIQSHSGSLDITVDGVVTPFREIAVAAEVAGKVVYKDEACNGGRFVTRGTRLVKIDPRDYELAVQRLKNQLEQADANLEELTVEISNTAELIKLATNQVELEQNEVDRLAGLIQEKIVTDSTLDKAKQAELTARNGLVQMQNQLQLLKTRQRGLESARQLVKTDLEKAELDLKRTEITAAVDGVVIDDQVERESFVQKGQTIFTFEDTSAVEVKCRLKMEELYWVWRQSGQDVSQIGTSGDGYRIPQVPVTIAYQLSDRNKVQYEWQGVLSRFDGIGIDEATRTVPCRILVDKPRDVRVVTNGESSDKPAELGGPPALVRGMYVTVTFHIDQPNELLLIPERAVQPGKAIWIVEDSRLSAKRSLELIELISLPNEAGDDESHWLVEAASSGLHAGDQVVVPPFGILHDGDEVRVNEVLAEAKQ